jgi:hypothetical protein
MLGECSSQGSAATASMTTFTNSWLRPMHFGRKKDAHTMWFFAAALLIATVPDDTSLLIFVAVGVIGYVLYEMLFPFVQPTDSSVMAKHACSDSSVMAKHACSPHRTRLSCAPVPQKAPAIRPVTQPARTPSAVPVTPPTFQSSGWELEVVELLGQIAPTPNCEITVAQITQTVRRVIRPIINDVEVYGFASGNITNGKAFGVAVPEVDIVISVSMSTLQRWLNKRPNATSCEDPIVSQQKVQKSAIRAFTDRLVGNGGFKFRRSAFRGSEPKVTLIAPSIGIQGESVPLNLFVNAVIPLHNAALVAECGQLDPRAKALVLLVKRWAKDRGVSHAAKGHLSPYEWTLLTIYFLQVSAENESQLLPPFEFFEICSNGLRKDCARKSQPVKNPPNPEQKLSVAELFQGFVKFYATDFDCRKEAVSVRLGQRAPPDVKLPIHIIVSDDGLTTEVGPSIEDPFEPAKNLGCCMTASSFERLREELSRADEMCSDKVSLTTLLTPWAPFDRAV